MRKRLLAVLLATLGVVGCAGNSTPNGVIESAGASGDKIEINADDLSVGSLKHDKDQIFSVVGKDGEVLATLELLDKEGYLALDMKDSGEFHETTNGVAYWLPESNTGVHVYGSDPDICTQVLSEVDIVVTSSDEGISDPVNEVDEVTEVVQEPAGEPYWNTSNGYPETYACLYYKMYQNDKFSIICYYVADQSIIDGVLYEADSVGVYDIVDRFDEEINGVAMKAVHGLYEGTHLYFAMSEDGKQCFEITNMQLGAEIDNGDLVDILKSFIKKGDTNVSEESK